MASLQCPWPSCTFQTPELEGSVAIQLLQMHQTATHPAPAAAAPPEKAKLPTLDVSAEGVVTATALGVFKQQVTTYKRRAGITGDDPDTILQALPAPAYSLMYARFGDNLTALSESALLTHIADLMVWPENRLAHILKLQRLKQDPGQPVAQFAAKLREVARQCQLSVKCRCNEQVSFEEELVLFQFLSGLSDAEVQSELLTQSDLTLAAAEQYAVTKETAKRSQQAMQSEELGRIRSSYQKMKLNGPRAGTPSTPNSHQAVVNEKCRNCGEAAHANRRQCKALNHICTCGRRGHLPSECLSRDRPRRPSRREATEEIGATLLELSSKFVLEPDHGAITNAGAATSNRLPVQLQADVSSLPQACQARGGVEVPPPVTCVAIADTGATVTCCGPDTLTALGVERSSLLPSDIALSAANHAKLAVWGALPVTISVSSGNRTVSALEVVYVSGDLSGTYVPLCSCSAGPRLDSSGISLPTVRCYGIHLSPGHHRVRRCWSRPGPVWLPYSHIGTRPSARPGEHY